MAKSAAIGDILVREGIINPEILSKAEEVQRKQSVSLGQALELLGVSKEHSVVSALAKNLRLESLNTELPAVPRDVAALLSADFCRKRSIAPLSLEGKTLRLALLNPMDYSTMQDVEFRTGKRVVAVIATTTQLQDLLREMYPDESSNSLAVLAPDETSGEVESVGESEIEVVDPSKLAKDTRTPPVIRLVNLILSGAAKIGASDIHMEPKESHLQVRYRVDGLLRDALQVPKNQMDATISRMKIISGMDIADRRRPQDGRSRLRFEGKRIDLRVSTLPTHFGEKVVVRLLDSRRAQITMDQLSLTPENLRALQSMLMRPQGMILVTGPTGSGKSSTLYTSLNWVKSPTKNIITVEDPIEYQLDGINQVQINTKAGVTFAAGLRSILRQDPNVILVGEIRDQETAGIALEAAQTGHLLLSTLHTNDAAGTISRLLDLGIEPFLIASAVIGILAQRLVRRPCPACAEPKEPSPSAIEKAGGASRLPSNAAWVIGRGCDACQQLGYSGRLAIHELLVMNDEIRDLISRRASEHAIRKAARNAGMRTLVEDGILKAAQGLTTLDDVVRVVAADEAATHREESTTPERADSRHIPIPNIEEPANAASLVSKSASMEPRDEPFEEPQATVLSTGPTKPRVLVVEDSQTIASVVKYFLELEGFDVLIAKDGATGLEMAIREIPELVVTDYDMPGMDGASMVRALRGSRTTSNIAVLMLTGEVGVEKETQALEAGVDDYIQKPVEPKRLAARVKALLARSRRGATLSQ